MVALCRRPAWTQNLVALFYLDTVEIWRSSRLRAEESRRVDACRHRRACTSNADPCSKSCSMGSKKPRFSQFSAVNPTENQSYSRLNLCLRRERSHLVLVGSE